MHEIKIFCDGGAIGNPGPGGWAAVIFHKENNGGQGRVLEIGGSEKHTTNNKMELTAAIKALGEVSERISEDFVVKVSTDSQYVINGITKWVYGWEKNGWKTSLKEPVLNQDLWQILMSLVSELDVTWEHVRGHSGVILNERVDYIANSFARGQKPKLFEGTEKAYKDVLETSPKSNSKRSGQAFSYISMVRGKIMTHKTWAECEKRVKGVIGAKFKKSFNAEEEAAIIEQFKKISK